MKEDEAMDDASSLRRQLQKPHFGLHLTFDAYQCDEKVLDSRQKCALYLNQLVSRLHMKKLLEPVVVKAKANDKKDPGGYSGFVMIQESHISIHTFVKRRFVTIDAYSCTDFDYRQAIAFSKTFFRARAVETNVIVRGKKYPMSNVI